MANFSDDDDGEPALAEARREDWSDAEESEGEEIEAGLVSRARTEPTWSDDDNGDESTEPKEEDTVDLVQHASALFGKKADPIGDLRTKAKDMNRKALDSVDKYVRAAAKEAKELRAASTKISALQREGQKKLDKVKKDKTIGEDAKRAQEAQFASLTAEIASITQGLKEQEAWMNRLLSQRVVPASGKIGDDPTGEWNPVVVRHDIAPRSSTSDEVAPRTLVLHLPAGTELSWNHKGKTKVHEATHESRHFKVVAGYKYQISNRSDRTATYMTIH